MINTVVCTTINKDCASGMKGMDFYKYLSVGFLPVEGKTCVLYKLSFHIIFPPKIKGMGFDQFAYFF